MSKSTPPVVKSCILGLIVLFALTTVAQAYTPPVGIPEPPFGIDDTVSMYDSATYDFGSGGTSYPDAGNGPYTHYVDPSDASATDSSNIYGTPGTPRVTIPRDLPAGSVVEIHMDSFTGDPDDPADVAELINVWIRSAGTAAKPVFIRGVSWANRPTVQMNGKVQGTYFIIENLDMLDTSIDIDPDVVTNDHIAVRYCEMRGIPWLDHSNPLSFGGNQEYFVAFRNLIHDNGWTATPAEENDSHGISIAPGSKYSWILENHIYHQGGDAVQVTSGGTTPLASSAQYVYIGWNEMHDCIENAIDIKVARDVVISENDMYSMPPGGNWNSASDGAIVVIHYSPENIWVLNNEIHDGVLGIRCNGAKSAYIVNNVFYDINHLGSDTTYDTEDNDSAILVWFTTDLSVIGNTFYNCDAGYLDRGNESFTNSRVILNNLFGDLAEDAYHLKIRYATAYSKATVDNNTFYDSSGVFLGWDDQKYTTLSSWQAASGQGNNCLDTNPNFVNADSQDFSLQSSSDSIDAGTADGYTDYYDTFYTLYGIDIEVDYVGTSRPNNFVYDIGAYEYDGTPSNAAPTVSAGADDECTLPSGVSLDGTVSDDGEPNPPGAVTTSWSKITGPGTVTFVDSTAVDTTATFSAAGAYVLRLMADDNALTSYDDVSITVNPQPAGGTKLTFPLADETVFVMLGDSIQAQNLHSNYIESYYHLRFPNYQYHFRGAGRGGSTLPELITRFEPDGAIWGPDIMTIEMTGNGNQAKADFKIDLNTLADSTEALGSESVLWSVGPMYRTGGSLSDRGDAHIEVATARGLEYVDQFYKVLTVYEENLISGTPVDLHPSNDEGHPLPAGHLIKTWVLLKEMGAPSAVSSAQINATTGLLVSSSQCTITNLSVTGNTVTFNRLDDCLPIALDDQALEALGIRPTILDDISAYMIDIDNLSAGNYEIIVDGVVSATVSAADLAAGYNMTEMTTGPIYTQLQNVRQMIRDKEGYNVPGEMGVYKARTTARNLYNGGAGLTGQALIDAMASYITGINVLDVAIHNAAQPVTRSFEITPDSSQVAPTVSAGNNQTITLPVDTVSLDGTVSDDGLPNPPATVTTAWSKVSGPGTVTFTDSTAIDTIATFSTFGSYVLRLSADDSELVGTDDVTITVNPTAGTNVAPTVSAGIDQTITMPSNALLDGTISDDGLPDPPAAFTQTWSKTSGPGTVTFADSTATDTTATFSAAGIYVIRVTADDSDLTAYDEVTITVNSTPPSGSGNFQESGGTVVMEAENFHNNDTRSDAAGTWSQQTTYTGYVGSGYMQAASGGNGAWATESEIGFDIDFTTAGTYAIWSYLYADASNMDSVYVGLDGTQIGSSYSSPNSLDVWIWENHYLDVYVSAGTHTFQMRRRERNLCVDRIILTDNLSYTPSGTGPAESSRGTSNVAPTVSAGADDSITLPSVATLDGSVSDDGLPSTPGSVTTTWSKISGPGTVTFGDSAAIDTTASFSEIGTYVLQLLGDDGDLTDSDTVQIVCGHVAPTVNAGTDDSITLPSVATLDATVSDDGFPASPGSVTTTWTKVSGPGTVTFGNSAAVDTTASFSEIGTYVLQLEADDGDKTNTDTVQIVCGHLAPTVNAGTDDECTLPSGVTLDGTVSDDGYPVTPGSVTTAWSKTSGPGTVTFGSSSAVDTTAGFTAAGTYVLRLTADDNDLTAYDELTISVNAAPSGSGNFQESGGTVVMEAEHWDDNDTNYSNANWTEDTTYTGYVGGGYMQAPSDSDGNGTWSGSPKGGAWLGFDIDFSTAGTYTIWVRRYATMGGRNSIYVGLNGTQIGGTFDNYDGGYNQWYWANGGTDVYVSAGTHTFQLCRRESYYSADRIILTDNLSYTPTGNGPAESSRSSNEAPSADAGTDASITLPSVATLDGTITDDGTATATWSKISGPGTVTFGNSTAVDTTASFSEIGTYVLQLEADDGSLTDTDTVQIVCGHLAPTVNAGSDDLIILPSVATLDGTVSDDGFPATPGSITTTWTKVSGPGTVTFGNSSAVDTTASFSVIGVYVLQLEADDGDLTNTDTVQITCDHLAPTVDAGSDDSVTLPSTVSLDGTVSDDGYPATPGSVSVTWTKTSGPGTVTFGSSSSVDTTASFSEIGVYVLRLTADDGDRVAYDEVTITGTHTAPSAAAGIDQTITLPSGATLDGTVTDDGFPTSGSLTTTWTRTSGPGTVTFVDSAAVDTTATFSINGTYVLRLTANDGDLTDYDELTVTVNPANTAPTVAAGSDDSCTLPSGVYLDATVTDDGLPDPPNAVTTLWEQIDGPGTVTFTNSAAVDTTATFSTAGVYVLRLTADDSVLTAYDEISIAANAAPVGTGDGNFIESGGTVVMEAENWADNDTRSDMGSANWSEQTTYTGYVGDGYMQANSGSRESWATGAELGFDIEFTTAGTYAIWSYLYADASNMDSVFVGLDGTQIGSSYSSPNSFDVWIWENHYLDVYISAGTHTLQMRRREKNLCVDRIILTDDLSYTPSGSGPAESSRASSNAAPTADAGTDQTGITVAGGATLDGTASDDGNPTSPGSITTTWSKISGPGTVTFGDSSAVDSTVSFSAIGTYVLQLEADDGALTATDPVQIVVTALMTDDFADSDIADWSVVAGTGWSAASGQATKIADTSIVAAIEKGGFSVNSGIITLEFDITVSGNWRPGNAALIDASGNGIYLPCYVGDTYVEIGGKNTTDNGLTGTGPITSDATCDPSIGVTIRYEVNLGTGEVKGYVDGTLENTVTLDLTGVGAITDVVFQAKKNWYLDNVVLD